MAHRLSVPESSAVIPAEQVRRLTIELFREHLPLWLHSYRYSDTDIFNVVAAAA